MKCRAIVALLLILISVNVWGQGRIKISGYVRDADGNPLDLVTVIVKGTMNGTLTNEKGHYSVSLTPGDSVVLGYSCLGYHKAERVIMQPAGDIHINVQMKSLSFDLGEAVVTANRRQITTMETIDVDRLRLLPDPAGGSIESLVVTYAGVSSSNELSSQYSVRGGSFDENMVYVNGMEVFRPLLIRSGQQEGLSFINPDMTESVNFAAGGFDARYGDKMSSVLDIAYKKPKEFEGSASASLLGVNAYVGSSVGKLTQVTGFRYKTGRSLLKTMDTDAEYDPNFIDLQSYITYQLAPKWEVNFLGNLAVNNYKFTPYNQETSFGTMNNPLNFTVYFPNSKERDKFQTLYGAFTLKHNPNENTEIGLQASAFNSKEEESYDITGEYWLSENGAVNPNQDAISSGMTVGRYHEHARNRLHSYIYNISHYGSTRLTNHTLRWGFTFQSEKMQDRISEWEKRDSAGYSLPHTGEGVDVIASLYSRQELNSTRMSGYLQDAFKFRTKQGLFTLIGGVRGSYWDYNKEFIFSPRASLAFIPNYDQNMTFRFATGLYYQSPFYKELRQIVSDSEGNETVQLNNKLKSQRSLHFILGGDYTFKAMNRNFKLTTELYYKKMDDLVPYTVDNVKLRYYGENCATGYAMGLDVKFFGEFVPGTDSWISFSLMKAEQTIQREGALKATKAPMPNSQGFNISLFFQDYFPGNDRLKLNLKGVLAGGLPVTVPHKGYEDGHFRLPAYKRIDMGLSYQLAGGTDAIMDRRFFRHFKNIWLGLDVFNLLDIKNTSSYYWITDVYKNQYAVPNYLTGRQLNLRLIVDF
ncbi:TonB-dependent receptor [Parabacteroides sp. 52]|uniref:TonB-dependent receptor n=1 Tax=unclassified Parabacteroides TaxID=2649774 RepID=UPI0013D400F8|nr:MULTISPECIES: TonB-dependent receptor [unclassified Parabacteroides]NDV54412.1 TonB-dependent receptor [Parabacteroides sp. 52]